MKNRPVIGIGELELRQARDALAAIVDEWVVRKNQIEIHGDPQIDPDSRSANHWFYDYVAHDDETICRSCNVRAVTWELRDEPGSSFAKLCDRCVRNYDGELGEYERIGKPEN